MAIIYTYPSGAVKADDLILVSEQDTVGSPTKNITVSALADFISPSGGGIGGGGTLDNLPIWTSATTLGDSRIRRVPSGTAASTDAEIIMSNNVIINNPPNINTFGPYLYVKGGANLFENVLLGLRDEGNASNNNNRIEFYSGLGTGTDYDRSGRFASIYAINDGASAANGGTLSIETQSTPGTTGTVNTGQIKLLKTGQNQFSQYGSGTFSGTATYDLSVDANGNIIETTAGIPWPYQYVVGDFNLLQGENPGATGLNNTTLGVGAGSSITGGGNNVFIGTDAGGNHTGAGFEGQNTGVGAYALRDLTSGRDNTTVGYHAGLKILDAEYNVAIGSQCMFINETGEYNTSVGGQSMRMLNGADGNTGLGYYAMAENQTGANNVAVGKFAAQRMNSGSPVYTVCVGSEAADDWNLGKHNTVIGGQAGAIASPQSLGAGTENVLLGFQAATLTGTDDNSIVIGANARGNGSNSITIGNTSNSGLSLPGSLPAFDDDAAAGVGGLTINMLYQTTGAGAAPLNAAGIVMIKQ